MYKVVINNKYGGFSLSQEALNILSEQHPDMVEEYTWSSGKVVKYLEDSVERHDKRLIEVIERLGVDKSSGECAKLYIEKIHTPMYRIEDYNGLETIHTASEDDGWVIAKG